MNDEPEAAFAETSQRNPNWTRDEVILALDLYLTNPANPPGKDSQAVLSLSSLLNKMHRLTGQSVGETFRNPNGVYLKMMNLRALDTDYTAEGKVGMKSGSRLDRRVWEEFAGNRQLLSSEAKTIRDAVAGADEAMLAKLPAAEPYEGEEGGVIIRLHRRYERDRRLITEKKVAAKAIGKLSCEVCEFDFADRYGALGSDFIEVHHTKPVHTMTSGSKTKLADLALLCSNCHRMAHRRRLPLSVAELKTILNAGIISKN